MIVEIENLQHESCNSEMKLLLKEISNGRPCAANLANSSKKAPNISMKLTSYSRKKLETDQGNEITTSMCIFCMYILPHIEAPLYRLEEISR